MREVKKDDLQHLVDFINQNRLTYIMHYLAQAIYLAHFIEEGTAGEADNLNINTLLNDFRECLYQIENEINEEEKEVQDLIIEIDLEE